MTIKHNRASLEDKAQLAAEADRKANEQLEVPNCLFDYQGHISKNIEYVVYCGNCTELLPGHFLTSQHEFEQYIKAEGWKLHKSRWYCPYCAKVQPQPV